MDAKYWFRVVLALNDGAKAVQFIRSKANEWNLNANKFALAGNSAGAGISLKIALMDNIDSCSRTIFSGFFKTSYICSVVFDATDYKN